MELTSSLVRLIGRIRLCLRCLLCLGYLAEDIVVPVAVENLHRKVKKSKNENLKYDKTDTDKSLNNTSIALQLPNTFGNIFK